MSKPRINASALKAVIHDLHLRTRRPVDTIEIAEAYQQRTGHRFNSDSFPRHLQRLEHTQSIQRSKDARGRIRYAPTEGEPT